MQATARNLMFAGLALLAVVLLPLSPGLGSDYVVTFMTQIATLALFAMAYNVMFGQTGLLSFGHAVFFGFGAFAAAYGMRWVVAGQWPIPLPLIPLVGALGGLLAGLVFAAVSARRTGTVFAMITFGLAELTFVFAHTAGDWFGGEQGISANRTKLLPFFGIRFLSPLEVYYLSLAWLVLVIFLIWRFRRSPLGQICFAVRDNAERAEFFGYRPELIRALAIVVSAALAGVAGALQAISTEIVASDIFVMQRSASALLAAYIGGASFLFGPVVGAAVLAALQTIVGGFTSAWLLYLGIVFVVMVLFAPRGVVGLATDLSGWWARSGSGAVARASAFAIPGVALTLWGAAMLIEVNYRLSTKPELGRQLTLFWTEWDTTTPWPWLLPAAALALGIYLLRKAATANTVANDAEAAEEPVDPARRPEVAV